jgi:hypothetical protein
MGREVTVSVTYPDGRAAGGVRVVAHNNNAAGAVSDWYGITGPDGRHKWSSLDTGALGDHYHFMVEHLDPQGVTWISKASDRVAAGPGPMVMPLRLVQALPAELGLPPLSTELIARIKAEPGGETVLVRFAELGKAIGAKMIIAPITLATSIIEGLLKSLGKRKHVWKEAWNDETFGQLIGHGEIRDLLPPGMIDRLTALNHLRKPAAHFKGDNPLLAESTLSAQLAREVAEYCYSPG